MSADEFWKDDPQLFVSYRTSFLNKKQREMEELDYKCWLEGLYIHDGNGKLFASLKQFLGNIVAGFTKGQKNHTQIDTYPKKPYGELKKDSELKEKENKKKMEYDKFQEDFAYFGSIKQRYLEHLKNKQKKGE